MPLYDRVVVEVEAFGRTGAFAFRGDLNPTRSLTKDYLVGGRGQVVSELYNQASDLDLGSILPDADLDRRAGFFLDAGAGSDQFQLSAEVGAGDEDLPWGDGSSPAGTVSEYDAAGDVHPIGKRDVLFRWLSQSRSDSGGQVKLYTGEWTDGTYADTAGVFGEPIPVALLEIRSEKPADQNSAVTYTMELEQVALVPDAVDEAVDDLSDAAQDAVDAVGDLIPDF